MLDLAKVETDRIVNYAIWGALTDLLSVEERKAAVGQSSSIRLALLAPRRRFYGGRDRRIDQRLSFSNQKFSEERLGGKHRFEHRGRPLEATGDFHQESLGRAF